MDLPVLPIPPGREYEPHKLPALLFALSEMPIIIEACDIALIHPTALEVEMEKSPLLRKQVDWAMKVGTHIVEARIAKRALGEKRPKVDPKTNRVIKEVDEHGNTVIVYDEDQSDGMLSKFAKRLRPDLYGDRIDVNHTANPTVYMPADAIPARFEEMLAAQADASKIALDEQKAKLSIELGLEEEAEFTDGPMQPEGPGAEDFV